jgi:hypothetical protein
VQSAEEPIWLLGDGDALKTIVKWSGVKLKFLAERRKEKEQLFLLLLQLLLITHNSPIPPHPSPPFYGGASPSFPSEYAMELFARSSLADGCCSALCGAQQDWRTKSAFLFFFSSSSQILSSQQIHLSWAAANGSPENQGAARVED